jgi:hypothetical protein
MTKRHKESGCASPKLHPACIFNNFIKLLAARTGNAVRRLRRSRLLFPNSAVVLLSAPAHPSRAINGFAIDGTTTRHKTYSTEFEVHYPWHPWFGLKVTINRSCPRQGVVCVQVTLGQEGRLQSLEMPGWMFDRAACAAMPLADHPAVGIKHLRALREMLTYAAGTRVEDVIETQHLDSSRKGDAHEKKEKTSPHTVAFQN